MAMAKMSSLERRFAQVWRDLAPDGPEPEREYRFAAWHAGGPGRGVRQALDALGLKDWRFDFCWPQHMVAVEVEGGAWVRGRHVRGVGYTDDCEKYNAAISLGWAVYRVTGDMLRNNPAKIVSQITHTLTNGRGW